MESLSQQKVECVSEKICGEKTVIFERICIIEFFFRWFVHCQIILVLEYSFYLRASRWLHISRCCRFLSLFSQQITNKRKTHRNKYTYQGEKITFSLLATAVQQHIHTRKKNYSVAFASILQSIWIEFGLRAFFTNVYQFLLHFFVIFIS